MNFINQQVSLDVDMVRLLVIDYECVVGRKLSIAVFKLVLVFVAEPNNV